MINVQIAYATPKKQKIIAIQINDNCTIEEAIKQSGILELFNIDLSQHSVGIFSRKKSLTDIVNNNDRIEIYRDLPSKKESQNGK